MKGPELLERFENNWETEMGAWFPGERVVLRGKNIFTDLKGFSWMEYLMFGIAGHSSPRLAKLAEGIWSISTSFPDPRLWNNRVAALAGTARSTGVLAAAGAVAVSEATTYGLKPIKGAMDFLFRLDEAMQGGSTIEEFVRRELKKYRAVYGYGRPIVDQDERIQPLMEYARSCGTGDGKYVKLAFEVEEYFKQSKYRYRMNIAAVSAALLADEGATLDEYYYYSLFSFIAGMLPCYIDSVSKPSGAFFPIAVHGINYTGDIETRSWGS